jgi:hypothetical protein
MTSYFTHEQRYRDLGPIADKPVTICGAGALGANIAESLARMGLRNLIVIDRDVIEPHNLSTQPWQAQDVRAPKALTLAHALYRAVGARVTPQHVELTEQNAVRLLKGAALVIDAFDNIPARRTVIEAAAQIQVPCLHLALGGDGDYGCALWDAAYHLPDHAAGVDGCDYPLTRPLALLVAAAGAEVAVRFQLTGARQGVEVTLRDLRMV